MKLQESFLRAMKLRGWQIKPSYLVGDELLWLMGKLIWNSVLRGRLWQIRRPLGTPLLSLYVAIECDSILICYYCTYILLIVQCLQI